MNQVIKPKKVLYVITKATWGGAQKYVYDLATNLPKGKFEPILAYGTRGKLANDLAQIGIKGRRLPSLDRDIAIISDIKSFFEMLGAIKEIQPDIIHLNSSKAAGLGTLAARIMGVQKIIFTVHGWPFKEDRNFVIRKLIYLTSWLTTFFSTNTIVVSKKDEEFGKRMWIVKKKVRHVPIGIRTPQFLSRNEASAALSITHAGLRLVTNSELTKNKGVRYAIEAVSLLKKRGVNLPYFIISDGEEREYLKTLAQNFAVDDRVYFLGFIPDAAQYLKAFDIFILPSVKEGMPYVLLEAAMAGLPIIATDIVQQEASTIKNIGFIPPRNGNALANAVEKLTLNMPAKIESAARSFEDMLKQTETLYT